MTPDKQQDWFFTVTLGDITALPEGEGKIIATKIWDRLQVMEAVFEDNMRTICDYQANENRRQHAKEIRSMTGRNLHEQN